MHLTLLKSKLHRGRVTRSDLDYEGSISIDVALMEAAGLLRNESVEVWNVSNGHRISTYVIAGGDGEIGINGAGAHLFGVGDIVIIAAFAMMEAQEAGSHEPVVIFLDRSNRWGNRE